MRVVFAGPSLFGVDYDATGIDMRPPAAQGDLLRAVVDGASVIGLIDGAFEATAAVWHKEILYALGQGVAVLGGASMGALRAAECAAFGMEPVGTIAHRYLDGTTDDDALVAIVHGPAELGSPPLTEALVDCVATIEAMAARGAISPVEAGETTRIASAMFYKDRTVVALARAVRPDAPEAFEAAYEQCRIGVKSADAVALIERIKTLPVHRGGSRPAWRMSEPPLWREARARAEAGGNI